MQRHAALEKKAREKAAQAERNAKARALIEQREQARLLAEQDAARRRAEAQRQIPAAVAVPARAADTAVRARSVADICVDGNPIRRGICEAREWHFCAKCGGKLAAAPDSGVTATAHPPAAAAPAARAPSAARRHYAPLAIALGAALLAIGVGIWWWQTGSSNTPPGVAARLPPATATSPCRMPSPCFFLAAAPAVVVGCWSRSDADLRIGRGRYLGSSRAANARRDTASPRNIRATWG